MKRLFISLASILAILTGLPSSVLASPTPLQVVALGDSYASGVGAGDYAPDTIGTCYRSANSYSEQLVARLRGGGQPVDFTNVTCSGATTDTVRQTQLDALGTDTDLVLISVGGNDAGFSTYGGTCIIDDCSGVPTQAFLLNLPRVSKKVYELLRDIAQSAPRAQVVLVGYGQPVAPNQTVTGPVDPICEQFTPQERQSASRAAGGVDAALATSTLIAREQGVQASYVSPYALPFALRPAFQGHSLCEGGEQWYHGFDALAPGGEGQIAIFHPSQQWQTAVMKLIPNKLTGTMTAE